LLPPDDPEGDELGESAGEVVTGAEDDRLPVRVILLVSMDDERGTSLRVAGGSVIGVRFGDVVCKTLELPVAAGRSKVACGCWRREKLFGFISMVAASLD
jgi:hypothetical protein